MMSVKSKNIHVLPTEKPSLLHKAFDKTFILSATPTMQSKLYNSQPYHIYITSDEEIKEDYVFAYGVIIKVMMFDVETLYFVNGTKAKREDCKKIILTTDQDLIKDGVQAIDDEFLEWFVKNPSCESIEINKMCYGALSGFADAGYKIIIPKEEPKQETLKQETLEEAAEIYAEENAIDANISYHNLYTPLEYAFKNGAKWQQEQIYIDIDEAIWLLKQTTEYEVLESFKEKVKELEQYKKISYGTNI